MLSYFHHTFTGCMKIFALSFEIDKDLNTIYPLISQKTFPEISFQYVTLHHKTTKKSPDMDF